MKALKDKAAKKIHHSAKEYHQSFKRKMLTKLNLLFQSRGGSFYGIGYIFTLLFLEVKTFVEEFAEFEFTVAGIVSQIIQHIIHLSIESVLNIVYAAIWPLMIFKHFSKPYNFIILIAIFITYLILRKILKNRSFKDYLNIPEKTVQQIIEPVIEQTNHQPDELDTLLEQAEQQQLDHWRSHPESCLALLLLLSFFSKNKSLNQNYCEKIIQEAHQADMYKHLSFKQQCFFYLPLKLSQKPALMKRAKKIYNKLNKKSGDDKLWFQAFSQQYQLN
ncbi:MAG TPA: DUF924 family protein [Aeromonadales bacterium]|nr:DUF924 family protein [Aeromonadales bacterium]